jgi:hypothetical protein
VRNLLRVSRRTSSQNEKIQIPFVDPYFDANWFRELRGGTDKPD